jgi:hypothetical protein
VVAVPVVAAVERRAPTSVATTTPRSITGARNTAMARYPATPLPPSSTSTGASPPDSRMASAMNPIRQDIMVVRVALSGPISAGSDAQGTTNIE